MIAIGTGAETAIEDQIRAAGMNLIVVTAGNYKVKSTDDFGGSAVEPSAAVRPRDRARVLRAGDLGVSGSGPAPFSARPSIPKTTRWKSTTIRPPSSASATARRARLRRDADLGRRRGDPRLERRAVCRRRAAPEHPCQGRREAVVHATARHRCAAAAHPPRVDVRQRPLLHRPRAVARRTSRRPRRRHRAARLRRRQPGRPRGVALEPAVQGCRRRLLDQLDGGARARRRSIRRRLHPVQHPPSAPEPVEAERHHDHRGLDRRRLAGDRARSPRCCARGTTSPTTGRTTSP